MGGTSDQTLDSGPNKYFLHVIWSSWPGIWSFYLVAQAKEQRNRTGRIFIHSFLSFKHGLSTHYMLDIALRAEDSQTKIVIALTVLDPMAPYLFNSLWPQFWYIFLSVANITHRSLKSIFSSHSIWLSMRRGFRASDFSSQSSLHLSVAMWPQRGNVKSHTSHF